MMLFKVALTRTYIVSIKAENEERAKSLSEFYLGDYPDCSTQKDRIDKSFKIEKIELIDNNATEIIEVSESEREIIEY